MPFAKAVSAKAFDWKTGKGKFVTVDSRKGREIELDFLRLMRIVLDAGYRGWVGIEHEGTKHKEMEGIRLTRKVLEAARDELAPNYV